MKWRVDDVPIFLAVVDRGGITAAARALDMPKSTVSTAISRLEQGLAVRLIDRNSRALRVTQEGETFYHQAQLIMDQVREADATVAGLSAEPSGRLTAALPPAFSQEIVAPRLAAFKAAHPGLSLEITVTTHGAALVGSEVDLAVVVGPLEDSDLIARTLLASPLVWVTSPGYHAAHDLDAGPEALVRHVQLCEKRYGLARLPVHVGGQAAQIDLASGVGHVNDPLVVRRAVMAGAGVSVMPLHYVREQIAEGSLVEVARHIAFDAGAATLTVVYPHRRLLSPRIRVFLDFLTEISAIGSGAE